MGRIKKPPALPLRDGVDPTRLVIAPEEAGLGLGTVLARRFPGNDDWFRGEFAAGDIRDADGARLTPDSIVAAVQPVWLYRQLPDEIVVPFDVPIIYRDENIVVVDKPPFLATMPRGARVVQSALVRLRGELGSTTISPAHRLDRLTSGVLLFTLQPQFRSRYQQLFEFKRAHKEYHALAPATSLALPHDRRSRIEKIPGDLWAHEVPGEPNAHTTIERLAADAASSAGGSGVAGAGAIDGAGEVPGPDRPLWGYRLTPHTGKTHQLRLHLAALGIPIVGDPLYPEPDPDHPDRSANGRFPGRPEFSDGFDRPLHLIARSLAFTDPVSGIRHEFVSGRSLADPAANPAANPLPVRSAD